MQEGRKQSFFEKKDQKTFVICAIVGGLVSVHYKQDGSWDLLNYHLYNAYALLNARMGLDLWVAGMQTYFNPLLDVPYYVVSRWWLPDNPRCVAFLAGLPFGALIPLVPWTAAVIWPRRDGGALLRIAAASLIGLTGTTLTSVIGSTSGDIPTAVLVMIGLLAVLTRLDDAAGWPRACAMAGVATGLAAGLKLTNVFCAPALGMAVLFCSPADRRWAGGAAFATAWCAGFLPPEVWWGARLWQHFANPLFPLFNGVFHSPWAGPGAARDTRFLPHSALAAIFYPFLWVSGRPFTVTEAPLYEPRFALAYLGIAAFLARHGLTRRRIPRQILFLLIFTGIAYIVWETLFSIVRYAVVLEALTGIWIILGLSAWLQSPRFLALAGAVALGVIFIGEKPYDGGRLKRYGRATFDISLPTVPDGAVIALTGRPMGFLVPLFPQRGLSFVNTTSLPKGYLMERAVLARLGRAPFALINREPTDGRIALRRAGWGIDACARVGNPFQAGIQLCSTRAVPLPQP